MIRFIPALVFLSAIVSSSQVIVADDNPSVLLVIFVAETEEAKAREQRFTTELGLGLDGMNIVSEEPPQDDFIRLPLAEQLALLQPFLKGKGVAGVVWMEEGKSDLVLLHLLAIDTGRALVRIVEAVRNPDVESELALAAAELLGEAYMFTSNRATDLEKAVAAVETTVKPTSKPGPPIDENDLSFIMGVIGAIGSGVYGHKGPTLGGVAGLSAEALVLGIVPIRLSASADIGPMAREDDLLLTVRGVRMEFSVAYLFRFSPLLVGPQANFGVVWHRTDITLGEGQAYSFDTWNTRSALGAEMRLDIRTGVSILLGGDLGVWSRTETNRKNSDGNISYATPRLDWRVFTGLLITIR